ncbi:MAG: class II aldolase/adducin family protein [Xanthomonadales bacterium]|nr:class II aldolase/adducin family protein [Xanthomonadales bacterium]
MSEPSAAQALLDAARSLGRTGNVGTSGNLSVRQGEGMLITPSGVPYEDLSLEDLVFVAADGSSRGTLKPSSEWRFHRAIYAARREAGAVVHCHAPHATALACLERAIPAFHYEVAFAGGRDIRCAPYATFGTDALSEHVLAALADRRACLMAHHGLVCFHDDLPKALHLAETVEQLARIYGLCLAMGEPATLPDDEMERVLEKFRDYGPR